MQHAPQPSGFYGSDGAIFDDLAASSALLFHQSLGVPSAAGGDMYTDALFSPGSFDLDAGLQGATAVPVVPDRSPNNATQPVTSGDPGDEEGEEAAAAAAAAAGAAPGRPGRRSSRTAEQKAQAVAAKNRRAQQRFRCRQKEKMRTLEEQMETLTAQVSHLSTENQRLTTTSSLKEKLLRVRADQRHAAQDKLQVFGAPADTPAISPGTEGSLSEQEIARVRQQSAEEVFSRLYSYNTRVATLLLEHDSAQNAAQRREAEVKMMEIVAEAGTLCMDAMAYAPLITKRMHAGLVGLGMLDSRSGGHPVLGRGAGGGSSSAGDGSLIASSSLGSSDGCETFEDVSMWEPLLPSLELTQVQVETAARLRTLFHARQERLLQERRQLAAALRGATGSDLEQGGMRPVLQDLVRFHEQLDAINANLREEHRATLDFSNGLYQSVFTPIQWVRISTYCSPAYPDTPGLVTAIMRVHNKHSGGSADCHKASPRAGLLMAAYHTMRCAAASKAMSR